MGVCDGSQFLKTLLDVVVFGMQANSTHRYHFTLLDHDPTSIAKILVILHLLSEVQGNIPSYEKDVAIAAMIFVYAPHITPESAHKKLQKSLDTLTKKLRDEMPIPNWIFIHPSQQSELCHYLEAWKEHTQGIYNTRVIQERPRIPFNTGQPGLSDETGSSKRKSSSTYKTGEHIFEKSRITKPDNASLESHDPALRQLFQALSHYKAEIYDEINNHLDQNLKLNVTLSEVDYKNRGAAKGTSGISRHLFDLAGRLHGQPIDGIQEIAELNDVFQRLSSFFQALSVCIDEDIGARLAVELVVGEMEDCLERIRYDTCKYRTPIRGLVDPQLFPKMYDRIHMSYIP